MVKKISFILFLLCSVSWIQANTFVVTTTNGADVTGSFANAIFMANNLSGAHTITFTGIATGSTITSSNATIYRITNSNVTIDATGKNITLNGSTVSPVAYGLQVMTGANNCVIKGLTFTNFANSAIYIASATGTVVSACRFNTNPTGTAVIQTNMNYAIYGNQAHDTKIGGSTQAERNYFAAIASSAVYFTACNNVLVTGNYFGVTSTGNALYTESSFKALHLQNCSGAVIGRGTTAAERNLFCGSSAFEIEIVGTGTNANIIQNNYFGYDANKAALNYYVGIKFTGASKNLIQNNSFAGTSGNPINATGTYIGNKLRQNSFENHSGDPPTGIINANVRAPEFYSTSSTIIKGLAHPGDSIEVYYANSYVKSGLTFLGRVLVPASGEWSFTGSFTAGQTIAITATDNSNNTTSWFTSSAGLGPVYNCTNTPYISTTTVCKNPDLGTVGFFPSGSVGSTTPANAGVWTTGGSGTFTNGGAYGSSTKYIPSAIDMAGSITLILTTADTNCTNSSTTTVIGFADLPVLNPVSDVFSCTNTVSLTGTPAHTYNSWSSLDSPTSVTITNGGTNSPTLTFSGTGSFRIKREVFIISGPAIYCYNRDTVIVSYKPTPVAPTGASVTTVSQKPVTYTVPGAPGEVLTAYYYTGSAYPTAAGATVTSVNSNTLRYVSSGAFYGTASYSYTLSNQCGGPVMGSVTVNVQNAPPVAIDYPPIQTIRKQDNTVTFYAPNYFTDINNDINPSSAVVFVGAASKASCTPVAASPGYFTVNYLANSDAEEWVDMDSLFIIIYDGKPTPDTSIVRIYRGRNLSDPADAEDIVVYEGISPDGDGVNDFLRIVNLSDYNNTVSIYNRWGDKVWEGKNYNNTTVRFEGSGNVGNFNPLPNGTYFYVIKNKSRKDNDGAPGLSSGFIIISRPE